MTRAERMAMRTMRMAMLGRIDAAIEAEDAAWDACDAAERTHGLYSPEAARAYRTASAAQDAVDDLRREYRIAVEA